MEKSFQMPLQMKSKKTIDESVIVYNFAVEDDESYILNGIKSHNCRCVLAPIIETDMELPQSNEEEFNQWLSS
jgi:hypothetical protein